MLANYVVRVEQTIGNMVATFTDVRAESEQDAIEVVKQHMATPHHWKSVNVVEME
jgi:hypothetical protein